MMNDTRILTCPSAESLAWGNSPGGGDCVGNNSVPWPPANVCALLLYPPSTAATLTGPTYSEGGVTYISGATTIDFTVTPNPATESVGPVSTYYRTYPVGGTPPAFVLTSGPFTLEPPDGAYQIEYYSVDAVNTQEATKSLQLTLDSTPPVVTITQPTGTNYQHSSTLTLNYSVSDGIGSGVASFTSTLDGMTMVTGHELASDETINLLTELALGSHIFRIESLDNVLNENAVSVTFTIIVTPDSIKDDVNQFLATRKITQDEGRSLQAKLNSAAKARVKGDCVNAASVYTSFISEVKAQSGKKIDLVAAEILIEDAKYLMAHCP